MPSAFTKAEQSTSTQQTTPDPTPASQHGPHFHDKSPCSLLPVVQGLPEELDLPAGGDSQRNTMLPDALTNDNHHAIEIGELRGAEPATQTCREGITDILSSPIAKLPNELLIHAIAHLSPSDFAAVSLVSRHFNNVVTTPHAWQIAFARHFARAQMPEDSSSTSFPGDSEATLRSENRRFTRLTALATWRSEYILRTRLLRSLARGKPVQQSSPPSRTGQTQAVTPTITYDTMTYNIVNHLHATFDFGPDKRLPRLIHGSVDQGLVTRSDPTTGKVDPWGQTDPWINFQFSERFPGTAQWGLGSGDVVGCPNVMDVSQPYGFLYGEGCPGSACYFRSLEEKRGRLIAEPSDFTLPEAGVPRLEADSSAVCSVWIAKSPNIPSLSNGVIGMMVGSAAGVISAFSLGIQSLSNSRLQRGELSARWVLSPGVPIIAISVDDNYSAKRYAQGRIWAVALNALGELFYLTKFPTQCQSPKDTFHHHTEYLAWLTGRSVHWSLVGPSRRTARPDPYSDANLDGRYSPRTSWDGMCLNEDQLAVETKEIQEYMRKPPKHYRKVCLGWDMRRRLEVDFAGDDGNHAGEAIIVFECGLDEGAPPNAKRFTRWKTSQKDKSDTTSIRKTAPQPTSLFGGLDCGSPVRSDTRSCIRNSSVVSMTSSQGQASIQEEWRCSKLSFGGFTNTRITTTTLDISTFATLTLSEDPALGFSTTSTASSPYESPMSVASLPASPSDIPGQRARFVAAGTTTGEVILWDVRAHVSRSSEYTNHIGPICIIQTESPEISCLAMTGLCIVVGGNDGLVQAWDPLLSSVSPIRTINSRYASKARRRLVQAQASVQGIGINMFAAGAICLDPDPTVLRGAVSLGSQVRYWSFSSSSADAYKGSKRKQRRSERGVTERAGSKAVTERFSGASRTNFNSYIADEQYELERDEQERQKQSERLAERFGTALLSEEELVAYATMLSQESMEVEVQRRHEGRSSPAMSFETVKSKPNTMGSSSTPALEDDGLDPDIAEAIRQSLGSTWSTYENTSPPPAFEIPLKYVKHKKSSTSPKPQQNATQKEVISTVSSSQTELSDLELAIQLSLIEEQSRKGSEDAFPPLGPTLNGDRKGKGKM